MQYVQTIKLFLSLFLSVSLSLALSLSLSLAHTHTYTHSPHKRTHTLSLSLSLSPARFLSPSLSLFLVCSPAKATKYRRHFPMFPPCPRLSSFIAAKRCKVWCSILHAVCVCTCTHACIYLHRWLCSKLQVDAGILQIRNEHVSMRIKTCNALAIDDGERY